MPKQQQQVTCPHLAIGFIQLHDGAIKMACGQCEFFIVLKQEDEAVIRKLFYAIENNQYV